MTKKNSYSYFLETELVSDMEIKCELPKHLTMKHGENDVIVKFGKDKKREEKALRVKHHIGLQFPKVSLFFSEFSSKLIAVKLF